jgi:uncharacterized repeat protein (TIGR03803 family)
MRITSLWTIPLVLLAATIVGASTEQTLHNFTGGTDGADPVADLLYDPVSGLVYGTTNNGGGAAACTKGCGTVFAIRPDGTGYTILYRFLGGTSDGANPQAGLVMDSSGNLYGTTYNGGAQNLGTVFRLTPVGGGLFTESVIHSFAGRTAGDGAHPLSRLLLDPTGNLVGTTFSGGVHNKGSVFKMQPDGAELMLYSFSGPDGSQPRAGVVLDPNQNPWGTTAAGGTLNLGVVFRLAPSGSTWTETFVYSFSGPDGASPYAAVSLDNFGDVFGTAKAGGSPACVFNAAGCGVVFEFQPSGTSFIENTLYSFTGGSDGATPVADLDLALDIAGSPYLYGTASKGGVVGGSCPATGCGTAFEVCGPGSSCQGAASWTEYTLFDFVGRNGGRTPLGGMIAFPPIGGGPDIPGFPPTGGKGKCTSGCMAAPSSGGTSGSGTIDSLSN